MERDWVTTEEGRQSRLGVELGCVRCDELAREVQAECVRVLRRAYEDAGISGLCAEGRWEAAVGALVTHRFDAPRLGGS
jgi:hypothetical protein